ncbi:MAG TPA: ABC transporter permease [Candidatus Acidoferrum sp.]|nr:ABC transporter permease [Candidatus Acidoferrum sp.]
MKNRGKLTRWLVVLGLLHVGVACAGFFGPYDPAEQDRDNPYVPPTRLHLIDSAGHWHFRPFFYGRLPREDSFEELREDTTKIFPLRFFIPGKPYPLLGFIPCRLRLFGAERSRVYLIGTDEFGRDLWSRILYGGQLSLLAGMVGTSLTLFLAACIGTLAGYFGGWRDGLLMRIAELFTALPWLYLMFALRAFLPLTVQPLEAFLLVIVVLGAVGWARPARLVRGVVLSEKERDFVRAARGFGASNGYLLRHHILPATWSVLLTQGAILVPQFVLAEMTLSFLGLGVPEPVPSWGNLLANLQQYSVLVSCWWMYVPALAVIPFFVGYLGLASALQEHADPYKIEA